MFDTTITIFNQQNGVWYPHVIPHAQVSRDRGYLKRTYGAENSDSIAVFVHYNVRDNVMYIDDTFPYASPMEYDEALDPSECITFRGGAKFDIIFEGEYSTVENDASYPKGFFEYMKRTHDKVYATSNVAGAFMNIPHFEITGR